MIFDFLITLGIVVLSIAVVMEGVKEGIEWIGNKIASKKAKEKKEIHVPATVWRVMAGIFSVGGVVLARNTFISVGEATGVLAVLLNKWMMLMWLPVVWWAQLQVDMKLIREHIVPMLKKGFESKIGAK